MTWPHLHLPRLPATSFFQVKVRLQPVQAYLNMAADMMHLPGLRSERVGIIFNCG